MKKNRKQKGFTLIELLVVIAIIAILAVVVVLTLNPAELLRQARDSNRISDFATVKSALALYATDVATTTSMDSSTSASTVGILYSASLGVPSTTTTTYSSATTTVSSWGFAPASAAAIVINSSSRSVTGTGWIPVNLSAISSGAPLGTWPVDPTNTGTSSAYVYAAATSSWKIATHMESAKYTNNGPNDVETNDGGNSVFVYEQGSNLTL
jgi:prepilin-type N-terminal cleavage/methylation domain-containing protein